MLTHGVSVPSVKPSSTSPMQSSSLPLQASVVGLTGGDRLPHSRPSWPPLHTSSPVRRQMPVPPSLHGSPLVGKVSSATPSQSLSNPSQLDSGSGRVSPSALITGAGQAQVQAPATQVDVVPAHGVPGMSHTSRPLTSGWISSAAGSTSPSQSSSAPLQASCG